ncbi:hypothetical protein KXR83_23945 [Williamsia muralis]|uniref:hypothetical protein n=1 Tax=Williamsia marianensis TaxID=85044 RepID=UPI003F191D8B
MNDSTGPAGDLIGTSVPGGTYELAGFEDWILRDTVYAGESDHAHPIAAFIGAQRGMGVSVSEFFTLLRTSIDDGPVLAETTIELEEDIARDRTYRVEGEVRDVRRKHGAAFGDFDLITCEFRLVDDRTVAARVTNVYAVKRGGIQ